MILKLSWQMLSAALLVPTLLASSAAENGAPDKYLTIPASDEGLPGEGPVRRYEWFTNLWAAKRAGWAKRVQEDQNAVVFLGDSITQGWGDNLGGAFPGMKVANRGISGDTTRGVLMRLPGDVLVLKPAAVVLLIGTNDLEERADPDVIASNLKAILASLKEHNPRMPIVLCSVFPSSESKKRPATSIKRINELYAAAVKGDAQVTPVNTWLLFADAQGDAKAEEFPDLLHPNQAGYKKWAAALRPILATCGFLETEPDDFKPEEGFVSLFNGRDLSGWSEKSKSFDGLTQSPDGRYVARNGRIVVTTPPEGSRIQQMWTTQKFPGNFTLKLEFRAGVNADSGIFIREPQLQCRDYYLAGPYKALKSYRPQEWNEIVVRVTDGVAHCTCNGEILEAELKVPQTGPIGLEGDRGQMEYRRIRIKQDQ